MRRIWSFGLTCLLFQSCSSHDRGSEQKQVIGKDEVQISANVALNRQVFGLKDHARGFFCNAFAITDREMLTASHCLENKSLDDLTLTNGEEEVQIAGIESQSGPITRLLLTKNLRTVLAFQTIGELGEDQPLSIYARTAATQVLHSHCQKPSQVKQSLTYDCDTYAGFSGAPILQYGKLVGIHQGFHTETQKNLGFAVTAENNSDWDPGQISLEGKWCGARSQKWQSLLIPDSFNASALSLLQVVPPVCFSVNIGSSAPFYKSCEQHDKCYWILGVNRGTCDDQFRRNLVDECERTYKTFVDSGARNCCKAVAEGLYAPAVRSMGQDSYESGQAEARRIAESFSQRTGFEATEPVLNLFAEDCLRNVNGDSCNVDLVSQLNISRWQTGYAIWSEMVDLGLQRENSSQLVVLVAQGGDSAVRDWIVRTYPRPVVIKRYRSLVGYEPDEVTASQLESFLVAYGYGRLDGEIYISYGEPIVKNLWTKVTGKPASELPQLWLIYYKRKLIEVRDIAALESEMRRQHTT